MVEHSLIISCIQGSSKAHAVFYKSTAPYVYTIVSSYISDFDYRKDTMQEAYASLFTKLHTYKPDFGPLKPWLRQVVVNACLQHLRKNASLPKFADEQAVEFISQQPIIHKQIDNEDLLSKLDAMPDRYRLVFLLSVIEGYSHAEIAEKLSIKAETSRSQLTRAKQWLRKYFNHQKTQTSHGLV